MKLVTKWTKRREKSKERLSTCQKCPEYDMVIHKCKECGCFMDIKTMFPSEECPLGKWKSYDENKG